MALDFGFPCKRRLGDETICTGMLYLYDKDDNHPAKKKDIVRMSCSWCGFKREVIRNEIHKKL